MFKKLATGFALTLSIAAAPAYAGGGGADVYDYDFSFEGPLGSYDKDQLQRGLQVFTEVCAGCHGLKYVPLRTLGDEGGPHLPEEQVRAYAKQFDKWDPAKEEFVPRVPSDFFPEADNPDLPAPDLSLMAKARAGFHGPQGTGINQLIKGMGGAEYIADLLMGYEDAPSCAPDDFDGSYNRVFTSGGYPDECKDEDGNPKYPGSWISMDQPLWGDDVEYAHGADTSQEALSKDVAAFLMWTAEPKLNQRKQAGFIGVILLSVLAVLLYFTNKQLWAPHKRKD
ncbi:MAG: cytochrome c1 [Planktomarina sp.]